MTNWKCALGLGAVLASSPAVPVVAQEQQIQVIRDTAAAICNTVKEAKGQKSDIQIEGDVKAQLGGLVGKLADVGASSKASLTREEFEGLSRDATAAALEGDRGCRERVFNKMFDRLNVPSDNTGKQSTLPRAEKLIVAIDLGCNLEAVFAKDVSFVSHRVECDDCSNKVNDYAKSLHIEPLMLTRITMESPLTIKEKFRNQITEKDVLEAFELGGDIYYIGVESPLGESADWAFFNDLRRQLSLCLRSLNLSEIETEIPKTFRELHADADWVANFRASVNGLVRKHYPSVSISE